MKQEKIVAYEFDELDEEAKLNVRNSMCEMIDLTFMVEKFEQDLEAKGIYEPKISYSGFWSQGDGLSFTGGVSDELIKKFINEKDYPIIFGLKDKWDISIGIERTNSRYVHSSTVKAFVVEDRTLCKDIDNQDKYDKEIEELLSDINSWKDKECAEMYESLEKEYYYESSDESISELCKDNGYLFNKFGKQINNVIVA